LRYVKLTHARFAGARFSRARLTSIHFDEKHSELYDGSDSLRVRWSDRVLNWEVLQLAGRLPLLGVSWSALLLSLTGINTIGMLNQSRLLEQVNYPIPVPLRMTLILINCLILVAGSTLLRLACPRSVLQFSESEWVEQNRQPRLLYLREKWSRRKMQVLAAILLVSGGGLASWLIGERLILAMRYISGL